MIAAPTLLTLISPILVLIILLIFTKTLNNKSNGKIRLPPGPPAIPIFGNLYLLINTVLPSSLQALSRRYGPLMTIRVGPTSFLVVSSADVAAEIFKTHDLPFSSKPQRASEKNNVVKDKSEYSFFMAEYGTYWKFIKKICMSALLSATQIADMADIRKEEVTSLLKTLSLCSQHGKACDVRETVTNMTSNIIFRMATSTRISEDVSMSAKVRNLVRDIDRFSPKAILGGMFGFLRNLDYFRYNKRLFDTSMQYDSVIDRIITEHEKDTNNGSRRKDLIDVMLEIGKDEGSQVKITKRNIKAVTMDIVLGATGSTAAVVQWVLAELINHPDILNKVRSEIENIIGTNKLVDENDIPNLPYLQAVIKEGLRLHPATPIITRSCREKCKINGYDVLPDTRVLINAYAIMRDPEKWDEPAKFVPERFLLNQSTFGEDWGHRVHTNGQSFEYMPFGGGRRLCPGAGLASVVVHMAVATLVQCFDWKIKDGEKVNMEEGSGTSLNMAYPMECYPILRFDPFEFGSG